MVGKPRIISERHHSRWRFIRNASKISKYHSWISSQRISYIFSHHCSLARWLFPNPYSKKWYWLLVCTLMQKHRWIFVAEPRNNSIKRKSWPSKSWMTSMVLLTELPRNILRLNHQKKYCGWCLICLICEVQQHAWWNALALLVSQHVKQSLSMLNHKRYRVWCNWSGGPNGDYFVVLVINVHIFVLLVWDSMSKPLEITFKYVSKTGSRNGQSISFFS